jgi:putative endonuclease
MFRENPGMNFRPRSTPFQLTLGERGEMLAAHFLIQKGYKILEKNYRCAIGEMDLIAQKNSKIQFIEVKTRTSDHYGVPQEAVNAAKQKKMIRIAEWYRKDKKCQNQAALFTVIAVEWNGTGEPRIRLIEDAFSVPSEQDEIFS